MQKEILEELENLKGETEFIINNKEVIENKHIEKYIRRIDRSYIKLDDKGTKIVKEFGYDYSFYY